jgi:exodeoxyribonuclease VII small subunit
MSEVPSVPPVPATFEAALAELESIVQRMESGELPLEESIAAFQRGVQLRQACEEKLRHAEQRVSLLDGEVLKPFSDDAVR